jgi:hypothetical protein
MLILLSEGVVRIQRLKTALDLRVSLLSTIFEVELDRDAHEALSLNIQTAAPRMQCRHSTMRIQKTS